DGTVVPTEDVRALCSKCHTDEGARRFKNVAGGYADLTAALPDALAPLAAPSPVQCRTCHNPHDPLKLLKDAQVVDGTVVQSSEFRTCTACHQTADALHGEASAYSWSQHAVGLGTLDPARIFYDTHFDDPATDVIEGYVLDPAGERACRGCHNVHAADATIQRQWANSGHGGRLLAAKDRAAKLTGSPAPVFQAGVDKADGPTTSGSGAWTRYDFKQPAAGRTDLRPCQRCHTTTGFRNFAADPAAYDPAGNQFTATGKQRELLYCWGCHTDNVGGVRSPGRFTADYQDPQGAPASYPDAGVSNLCLPCHTGRRGGQAIKEAASVAGVDFSGFNSHYRAAGGVLYRKLGYEFDGQNYGDPAHFRHDTVGTPEATDAAGTPVDAGSGGRGVGGHWAGRPGPARNHRFLPYTFDDEGEATGVAPLCGACHQGPYANSLASLTVSRAGYEAALAALRGALAARGIHHGPTYPYFFTTGTAADQVPANAYRGWPDRATLGAAFNYNLLHHEPGGFAHNRYYVKRLIFDSIDWLAEGTLDGTLDLRANPTAAAYLDADPAQDFDAAKVRRP
ncbi:MAG: hypothetical protein ACYDA8_13530, partial [Deferrisomatales bacterium]